MNRLQRFMLKRKLLKAVKSLDLIDPSSVRNLLVSEGITGYKFSTQSCPIASYLVAKTGHTHLTVNQYNINFWLENAPSVCKVTPVAANMFIRGFDSGLYPELVKEPKRL